MSRPTQKRSELLGALFLALREVRGQLLNLNQSVGEAVGLGTSEIEFLDLISRTDRVTPGALADATGLSPATVTGVLDRLETQGWVKRERDDEDRRRVFVAARHERVPQLGEKYAGMLRSMAEIYAGYTDKELALILDFLTKVRDAGKSATDALRATR